MHQGMGVIPLGHEIRFGPKGGGSMKIGDNEQLRAFNRANYEAQGKNMSAKKKDNRRNDELKISLKIPQNAARDAEIRKE